MALRTWGKVLLTALGVAAAAGAGQLGVAYGLGIVRFTRSFLGDVAYQWSAQLAWVAWFAMLAAVAGAIAGDRMAARYDVTLAMAGRVAVAAVAGVGAGIVAPLCMQPARASQIAASINPVLTVGLTAAAGALVGVFAAVAALSQRAVAWSLTVVAAAVWFLALVSVSPSLGPTDPLPVIRLGVLDLPSLSAGTTRTLALIGIPALMLLTGTLVAALSRWLEHHPMTVAVCGAGGAGLLAFAYLLAGPGEGREQAAPYWGAVIGLAAGVLGSVLVAFLPQVRSAVALRWRAPPSGEQPPADRQPTSHREPTSHRKPDLDVEPDLDLERSPGGGADPDRQPDPDRTLTPAFDATDTQQVASGPNARPAPPEPTETHHRIQPAGGTGARITAPDTAVDDPYWPAPTAGPASTVDPAPAADPASAADRAPTADPTPAADPAPAVDPAPPRTRRGRTIAERAAMTDTLATPPPSEAKPAAGGQPATRTRRATEAPPEEAQPGTGLAEQPDPAPGRQRWRPRLPSLRRGQRADAPLPPIRSRDEEYVEWVSGLAAGRDKTKSQKDGDTSEPSSRGRDASRGREAGHHS